MRNCGRGGYASADNIICATSSWKGLAHRGLMSFRKPLGRECFTSDRVSQPRLEGCPPLTCAARSIREVKDGVFATDQRLQLRVLFAYYGILHPRTEALTVGSL